MIRSRVPVGHPWALGTVKGGGRRCTIDKSNWLYTQNSNNLSDAHGIVWSTPRGKRVPMCQELLNVDDGVLVNGQIVLDANWVDSISGLTRDVLSDESTVSDFTDRTICTSLSVPHTAEFVYPNTLIRRYGDGTIVYETITPIDSNRTMLTWCTKSTIDARYVVIHRDELGTDAFQSRIMNRLESMVVDDLQNTFVLL